MKLLFILPVFFLFFICETALFSQSKGKRIINVKTAEHVTLPGHHLFLELPEGYARAPHFSGWQNPKGSHIMIGTKQKPMEETLSEIELILKAENYLPERKNLRINGQKAVLIEAEKSAEPSLKKSILLIEKNETIYIIEGKSTGGKEQNDILKKSILTSFIEN